MSKASDFVSAAASVPSSISDECLVTNNGNASDKEMEMEQIPPPVDLLQWKDMPKHLQFNQYIMEGYRPLTNVKGCIHSLFYFHNETVNIFTHGIPVLYILATVPYLMPWSNFRFLSWCHLIGSLAPWCGSFVYHLFMNLDRGEVVYYRLLKLDMFGIWMSQSFGAITFVTATAFCWRIKWLLIFAYCVLCLWGLYKALLASSPWQRRLCFLFPFVMRMHLVVLRMFKLAGGNTESMVHVYLQDGVSIIGGAIGAMNIPEKWLPGNVDFCLNSHNIMHVLVVVAVYSMHQATMRDLEWMSKNQCHDNNTIDSINDAHTEL